MEKVKHLPHFFSEILKRFIHSFLHLLCFAFSGLIDGGGVGCYNDQLLIIQYCVCVHQELSIVFIYRLNKKSSSTLIHLFVVFNLAVQFQSCHLATRP